MSTDETRTARPRWRVRVGDVVEPPRAASSTPTSGVLPSRRVRTNGGLRAVRVTEAPPENAPPPVPPAPDDWQERIEAARVEGLERARAELTARFESALRDLQIERNRLEKTSREWADTMAPHLLDLSLEIAQRLVAHEIEDGGARIEPLVQAAVRELRDAGETDTISIALHPDDYASLRPAPQDGRMAGVEVLSDRDVDRGACRLRSGIDSFAVTLEARLDEVRRSLDRRAPKPRTAGVAPNAELEIAVEEAIVGGDADEADEEVSE